MAFRTANTLYIQYQKNDSLEQKLVKLDLIIKIKNSCSLGGPGHKTFFPICFLTMCSMWGQTHNFELKSLMLYKLSH